MIKEIMDEILQAEQRADEIVAEATAHAKEIRLAGERESAAILADGKKAAADLLASLERETDLAAAREEAAVLEQGKRDAAAVGQGAEGRVAEAAEAVENRLLEKYGVAAL